MKLDKLTNVTNTTTTPRALTTEEINDIIVDSIQDIKGQNIIKLDLRKLYDAPTDYFIICEGTSNVQISAIAGNLEIRLRQEAGLRPSHLEGANGGRWVLADYFYTVLHIFHPEAREFYDLESLWSDALSTQYQNI